MKPILYIRLKRPDLFPHRFAVYAAKDWQVLVDAVHAAISYGMDYYTVRNAADDSLMLHIEHAPKV